MSKDKEEKQEGPRSFARFIETLADGNAHADMGSELFELIKNTQVQAKLRGQTLKASMTVSLKFNVAPLGTVGVSYDVSTVEPKRQRLGDTLFITKNGNLSKQDERQSTLPGLLRDMSATARVVVDANTKPVMANGALVDPETGEVFDKPAGSAF